jgi:manganese oxidase
VLRARLRRRIFPCAGRAHGFLVLCAVAGFGVCAWAGPQKARGEAPTGRVRTYYVAADEVEWDYAPSGLDQITGKPFEGMAKMYMEHGPHRIGHLYKKALYREYTDETFSKLKARAPEWEHAGILGPILRAEVGDTVVVHFKNNGTHAYSMHPHGLFYDKASEGSAYVDGSDAKDAVGGAVPPGQVYTYRWEVPERAGPGPRDGSSIVWLYHSHTEEMIDVNSGLIGAILVTRRGMALPDGRPKDVDREFVALYMTFDENQSWFIDENIRRHTDDPAGVQKDENSSVDVAGRYNFVLATGFTGANVRYTINGRQYGDLPMMTMKVGERVRWYLMTVGYAFNFHTAHWHGNVVSQGGERTDVVALGPAQTITVDMMPDDPGIWLFHCHVSDHMEAGMITRYEVRK